MEDDNQFPLEEIIKRTIESNYGYVKNIDSKNNLLEILSPIIVVCFQDHSQERTKQLEVALDTIDSLLVRESPLVSWVYYLMSDARKREGQMQSAVDFGMESLKIREEIYGNESNEVCICLDHLSSIFFDVPDYPKAIKFFLQASDIKWKMGYCPVPQLSRQCAEFAASLKELKQYQAALDLLARAKLYITSKQGEENNNSNSNNSSSSLSGSASSLPTMSAEDSAVRQERDGVKLQILFEMGAIFETQGQTDKLLNVYEELLEIYTCDRSADTVKDVTTTYDYLLSTYMALERFKLIRHRLGQLTSYVGAVSGLSSLDTAVALRTSGRILADLSNTNSATRLCDLADSVRYYTAILRIASGYSQAELTRFANALPLKDIRETVEMLLYNSRPMRKDECSLIVDKILGSCSVDFLLDTAKSQNYFLKIVYPSFMAEDSLREKADTIPTKSGSLAKYGLMKSWKPRFFAVERDTLYYYEFPNDPKPQGEYSLLEVKNIEILAPEKKFKPHTHCFMLVTPKRNIILAADTVEIMMDWVGILTKAKNYWEEWNVAPLCV